MSAARHTPHRVAWWMAHLLVWAMAFWIVGWAAQAQAPHPLWLSRAAEHPYLLIKGQEQSIRAVETPDGIVPVTPQWHGLPPHVQPTLADKHRFEAIEEQLIAWTGQPLAWIDAKNQRWPVTWGPMGLAGIPTISWMLLLTSVWTWHLALWNLAQRPRDNTTRLYVLAGIAFTVGNLCLLYTSPSPRD